MVAGLQRHISRRTPCQLSGSTQRVRLGMRHARFRVVSKSNDLAGFRHDDAPHTGVGVGARRIAWGQ